jgi:hypothetical protein
MNTPHFKHTLNLWDILKTQKINARFAVKYILHPIYKITESEKCINHDDVLFLQPHISSKDLYYELVNYVSDDETSTSICLPISNNNIK